VENFATASSLARSLVQEKVFDDSDDDTRKKKSEERKLSAFKKVI
jgi:hypothetical protein